MKWLPKQIAEPSTLISLIVILLVEFARNALILSVLPNIAVGSFELSTTAIGLAISVHYFFDNILRTPMGALADHFGHRYILTGGLLVAAVGLLIIAGAHSPFMLTVGAAIFGIGTSPLWPSVISLITTTCPDGGKASAMGYIYTAWVIGGGAGPIVINFLLVASYRITFVLLVGIVLICGLLAFAVTGRVRPAARESAGVDFNLRRYLREMIVHLKEIRILFPGMFVQTFAIGVLIPVLTPYARLVLGVSPQMQSGAIMVVGGATVLLLPIMGRLVDSIGARPFLSGGFILASVALLLFSLQKNIWLATGLMLVLGVAYSMILPSWNSVLDFAINREKRAAMWGMFMTIEGLGTALGPIVGGRLWDLVSPQAPFFLSGGVVGTMGLLYVFLRIPGLRRHVRAESRAS